MIQHKLALHIFRRDLRIEDNTSLIHALENSEKVIPCFIFDDRQIKDNSYKSNNALQFMIECIIDLDTQLQKKGGRIYLFSGIAEEIIEKLINTLKIDAVFYNKDYTPFSKKRDDNINLICKRNNVYFKSFADVLLNEPERILKNDGKPYTIFTPYLKKAKLIQIRSPQNNTYKNYYSNKILIEKSKDIFKKILADNNIDNKVNNNNQGNNRLKNNVILKGGRTNAIKLLNNISKLKEYAVTRNIPSINGTSFLSAHNKFGTVSIREVYHTIEHELGIDHILINELYWRDFFTHIAYHFPYVFQNAFNKKYDKIKWSYDEKKFKLWCDGKTGFPLVDSGMRQLNRTGWMHNRVRMVTASFLVKDLHIDWRLGEKYFAQKLIDYDPSVNNGNWQWAASTGCDAQPYFRIFNPWMQQEKFDYECKYIKEWISELQNISPKEIHKIYINNLKNTTYPKPIVDHKEASSKAKAMYKFLDT
ncbi:MAG: cryptochrome/photolyase family protein [Candidatus Woesearchaeota archaeon]